MVRLAPKSEIVLRARSPIFWLALVLTVFVAWVASGLAGGITFGTFLGANAAWSGGDRLDRLSPYFILYMMVICVMFALPIVLPGVVITLPLTVAGAIFLRTHWLPPTLTYAAIGSVIALQIFPLNYGPGLWNWNFTAIGASGAAAGAAYGWTVWRLMLRDNWP